NRTYQQADTLSFGDAIFIRGRWVYDASHGGANELHAVLDLQRVPDPNDDLHNPSKLGSSLDPDNPTAPQPQPGLLGLWCSYADHIPMWSGMSASGAARGAQGATTAEQAAMSPAQVAIYQAQCSPANRWTLHPLVDGCEAAGQAGEEVIPSREPSYPII